MTISEKRLLRRKVREAGERIYRPGGEDGDV